MKQDKERYDKFKENDKLRKWAAKKNKEEEEVIVSGTITSSSLFFLAAHFLNLSFPLSC